jgi:hypothetical protein
VADSLRAEGEQRIEQLAAPVGVAGDIPPGRAVAERQLDFTDRQPGVQHVDRHADLAAETGGEREADAPSALRESALAGERLPGLEAGPQADERAGHPLGDAEAASPPFGERGHA